MYLSHKQIKDKREDFNRTQSIFFNLGLGEDCLGRVAKSLRMDGPWMLSTQSHFVIRNYRLYPYMLSFPYFTLIFHRKNILVSILYCRNYKFQQTETKESRSSNITFNVVHGYGKNLQTSCFRESFCKGMCSLVSLIIANNRHVYCFRLSMNFFLKLWCKYVSISFLISIEKRKEEK